MRSKKSAIQFIHKHVLMTNGKTALAYCLQALRNRNNQIYQLGKQHLQENFPD